MNRISHLVVVLMLCSCAEPFEFPGRHACETVGVSVDEVTGELDAPCDDNVDCNEGLGCDANCTDYITECMGICAPLNDPNRFCRFGACKGDTDCGAEEAADGLKICRNGFCVLGPNSGF